MSEGVRGIDVSSWQHPGGQPIEWEAVADDDVVFALVKATQGVDYTNPWLERDLEDALGAGLLVGAYHYYEAGVGAAAQADHFVGSLIGRHLHVHAWLDWECYAPEAYTHSAELAEFLTRAREARPGTGVYLDEAWLDTLRKESAPLGKVWLASGVPGLPSLGQWVTQTGTARVPGVPAPVDVDWVANTRSLDLPTSPPPRPSAATVRVPALPPEPEEEKPGGTAAPSTSGVVD